MLLNAKRMAFLGLLLAITMIMVILGNVLKFNTLFFMAGASFGVGIAVRECGLRLGFGFLLASVFLSFILAPNKVYCITFSLISFYVYIIEFAWEKLADMNGCHHRKALLWAIKYVAFNCIFLSVLLGFPKLIYPGVWNGYILGALILGGQIAVFIFDRAYHYFHIAIWGKFRGRL